MIQKFERINYAKRADRIVIRHGTGRVVAIIEIVSPGTKDIRHAIRSFVEKAADVLSQGIHLVIVDLFPPPLRDPQGIHKAISYEFSDEPFDFLPEKPLTVAVVHRRRPADCIRGVTRGGRPTAAYPAVPHGVPPCAMPAGLDLRRSVAGVPGHAQGSGGIASLMNPAELLPQAYPRTPQVAAAKLASEIKW